MTEADEDGVHQQEYHPLFHQHQDHNHHHTARPLGGAEAYHRFLWHNKHVIFELKLSVMVVVGAIIIVVCVVYIALQCRARVRPVGSGKNRRDDEKELFGSSDTLENLIPPVENSIRLKVRREQEFFV
ncbi:hypothetical protein ACOMHN_009296 [Nucella lapillus]